MHVNVKLYGDLKRYAPGNQYQFVLTLTPGATLGEVVDMYAIPSGTYVTLINGRRVDRDKQLSSGDTLVLFPPISGG